MKYCSECGNKAEDVANFCSHCGKPFDTCTESAAGRAEASPKAEEDRKKQEYTPGLVFEPTEDGKAIQSPIIRELQRL